MAKKKRTIEAAPEIGPNGKPTLYTASMHSFIGINGELYLVLENPKSKFIHSQNGRIIYIPKVGLLKVSLHPEVNNYEINTEIDPPVLNLHLLGPLLGNLLERIESIENSITYLENQQNEYH